MTKRLTIALVALAFFVLVVMVPVSANKTATGPNYYYTVAPNINAGATIYLGEQGLNLSSFVAENTLVGFWASGSPVATAPPDKPVTLTSVGSFTVAPAAFATGYQTANWYNVSCVNGAPANMGTCLVFTVADPSLDLGIYAPGIAADVTGKSVTKATLLQFDVKTNMYSALDPTKRSPVWNVSGSGSSTPGVRGDGYININVRPGSGSVLSQLYTKNVTTNADIGAVRLTSLNVTTQPWKWGLFGLDADTGGVPGIQPFAWDTGAKNANGEPAYPAVTYTVWADSLLNNMKENYKDSSSAYYTGKTISAYKTVTLVSDSVKITVDKDSVVRSNQFTVTITGRPSAYYCVWVKGVSGLDNDIDDQPPMLAQFQAGVADGTTANGGICANYTPQNYGTGTTSTILYDVANPRANPPVIPPTVNNAMRYANVSTSTSGTRAVTFDTTQLTKAQKYTIRVEADFGTGTVHDYKSDQVDVNVEKGAITIVAAGDQNYYLGEEVKFSGTNTESDMTYMFIIGPNLPPEGAQLLSPRVKVDMTQPGTYATADVLSDNTWSYKWGTSQLALDAGTYTVYATSQVATTSATDLNGVAYGTVSVIIKKPFVSATASQSTLAKGDKLTITGTAEGQPSSGVAIWIMGKNYAKRDSTSVNSDSTFKFELEGPDTSQLYAGQYFVVVQHPMQNNVFDIVADAPLPSGAANVYVINEQLGTAGTQIFKIQGSGSLQGSDAAEALVQGINDPNVDDTYTKLQFLIEEPVINIVPIGDKHVGDKFTIKALTNLAVDDEILCEVYSSSFKPTQKSQSGEFSGATGTVKVTKGDSGMNTIEFPVDASTFKPDEYIVSESAVIQEITGTALFNVLEGAAPTAKPTAVPTTVAPTTVATPVPTTVKPTPTPTKSPGYGALIALIGLGAVAFIVVRRH